MPEWRDCATTALSTALLALFWWLAVSASLEKSQTSDELPHIGAGYVYDRFGDFRMQPENGNLPQRLFGLPALLEGASFPLDETLWRNSAFWQMCWDFLYAPGSLTDWLVLCARALNALFGVALGGLIFGLARAWHGRAGGLLALAFYVLAPNFLAHSAFATSDMAGTLFLTLAPWLFWRHLQRRDFSSALLAGVATGLAFVSKHNAVLLVPVYALLGLLEAGMTATQASTGNGRPRMADGIRRILGSVGLGLFQGAVALLVTWTFYHFRYEARGPGTPELSQFLVKWGDLYRTLDLPRHVIQWARDWQLLPEAWLYGLAHVLSGAAGRPAFFAGEHSLHGWWQFFPTLFLTKTSLGMLAALAGVLTAGLLKFVRCGPANRRHWLERYAPLLITAAVVWFTALTAKINIGDRHILPVYPVLFVALGFLASNRVLAAIGAVGFIAHAAASFNIRPHYLAAFNALGGGPENAHRLFVDSSLDWGQDLPALERWIARHRGAEEPFYLSYFGNAWPPHYGVRPTTFLNPRSFIVGPPLTRYEMRAGLYALSATDLTELYSPYRGPWTENREFLYRTLRARFSVATAASPAAEHDDYARYNALRLSRLCKFLQRRMPDGQAGYSILIFRLTDADLHAALNGPVTSLHRIRLP